MLELARREDFDAVNAIAAQVHALHVSWRPDLYCHTDCLFPMDFYLECIEKRSLFVARMGDQITGILLFCIWNTAGAGNTKRKVMRIDNIAVEETLRGNGIGRAMMIDVRALARAFGCDEIVLNVYPQNDAAIAFYEKCGFTIRNIGMQMKL